MAIFRKQMAEERGFNFHIVQIVMVLGVSLFVAFAILLLISAFREVVPNIASYWTNVISRVITGEMNSYDLASIMIFICLIRACRT